MLHTKKDYQDCLMKILEPLIHYYTDGNAGVKCGATGVNYSETIAKMEGFARGLWGLAPFWGGKGEHAEFETIYRNGISNGTNPKHEEYWGEIKSYDQKHVDCALNNWQFFAVIVNLGFKCVGMPYNEEILERNLERIESYYKANGWYSDGNTDQYDYYIAFAIHFYSLIYAKVMDKEDPERSKLFKERAIRFAQDFIYWFAEDGSALAFGRSLTYRFAQCCFWSACVFAGIEPFPMGVMKGIISRNLEWWLSKPIFDNGGVLSIGYAYPNLNMAEGYNGFGSPYWALKAFLILALDDEHEFFKTESQPLPKLDKVHPIPESKMVIQRINGNVVALTAGQWASFKPVHVAEKYAKFAYSSKYAFCIQRSAFGIDRAGIDSMLTFVKDDLCFGRRTCKEAKIEKDGTVYSKWSPFEGISVETYMIPTEKGHIRRHKVFCEKDCVAYDAGFAVPLVFSNIENSDTGLVAGKGDSMVINCQPNMNLMNVKTAIRAVKYEFSKGINEISTEVIYPKELLGE